MAGKMRSIRLRNRILIWSFVPSTIILFAVAVTIYFAYQQVTEDLVVGRNQQLIHLSAGQLSASLAPYIDTLSTLTHSADVYSSVPPRQTEAINKAANSLLVFDGGVLILDASGRVIATTPNRLGLLGDDWSEQSFYNQIIRSGTTVFSDILTNDQENLDVIAVAAPIVNEWGEFRGTLVGMFQIGASGYSAFYASIIKLRLGTSGSTFLVDGAGRVVYHPDSSRIGIDLSAQPAVQRVLQRQVGYLRTRDQNNNDVLATFAPVPGTSWGLVNEEDWANLLLSSRGYGQFLYLLLGLGVVMPSIVVLYGIKQITDPVSKLIVGAKEIAEGKYGQEITVKTGDELEELVTQFNRMSRQLQESYTQLEQRVASRTKELATLNTISAVASRSLDLREILTDALAETIKVLEMECGGAYALDRLGTTMTLMAHSCLTEDFGPQDTRWRFKGSAIEHSVLAGEPLIMQIDDCPEVPLKRLFLRQNIELIICVPLMMKRSLAGTFILGGCSCRDVSPEEVALMEAIGQQIGIAVENAHLYEQAAEMAALSERNRLARDLHDAVSQTLFSASLIADVLPKLWERNPQAGMQKLEEMRLLTRGALSEMRTLLLELRPASLLEMDMGELMRHLTNAFAGRTRLPIDLVLDGQIDPPPDVKEVFYRIAQESLNNISKHAAASNVIIRLQRTDTEVRLEVEDNGSGFDLEDVAADSLGLGIMRERAAAIGAELSIQSQIGQGTHIELHWKDTQDE